MAELAEAVSGAIVEVTIIGAGGQAGEVQLDGEVDGEVAGEVFEQVGDFERRAAGGSGDAFGDANVTTGDMAQSRKLNLNSIRGAADFRFINALDEVAVLGGFAAG